MKTKALLLKSRSAIAPLAMMLSVTFAVSASSAQILKVEAGTQTLEGVALASSATTDKGVKLNFAGAGLRAKKVVMVNVNVYVAQVFAADVSKLKKSSAEVLSSLSQAQPVAIQLRFLRDVDAEKVQTSFKEALEANKVDVKKAEVQKILEAVKNGGEAKKGKSLTIVAAKNPDGTESITYEDANAKAVTVTGPAGFMKVMFSIWLGEPSDDGVARMKTSLLK